MKLAAVLAFTLLAAPAWAWEGFEPGTDDNVRIEEPADDLREGEVVEIYDENADKYEDVEVESVKTDDEGGVEVEVHDEEEDADRIFRMEEE